MRIKLECCHADTCTPDYWSGHHLPHVSIPVYRGMTLKAIKAELRDELRQGAVCGSDDDARLLSADVIGPGEEKLADTLTRAAYAAINRLSPVKKGTRKYFMDLDEQSDEDCSVYAYFVFMPLE